MELGPEDVSLRGVLISEGGLKDQVGLTPFTSEASTASLTARAPVEFCC